MNPSGRLPVRAQHSPAQRGFTLIEIMVVVVIIAILATLVTLSIGNRALDDRMQVEASRLQAILQLASEEAELKGIDIGLRFTQQEVQLLAKDKNNEWASYTDTGPLRSRELSQPFYIDLYVESRPVPPASAMADKDNKLVPQVLLLSSGEVTAFAFDLHAPGYRPYYHLDADALGKTTLERKDGNS